MSSAIYNQVYQVPVWVVLNLREDNETQSPKLKALSKYLIENGAQAQGWPSWSFGDTINKMAARGWAHAVKTPPYIIDSHFVSVAAAEHAKAFFGSNKLLNMGSTKPWHHVVNRKVEVQADYGRIFDHILALQDPITLSHLFDIGDKCHTANVRTHVFFTVGTPAINLLRLMSRSVIVVSDTGEVAIADLSPEEAVSALDQALETAIRQQQR